MKIYYVSVENKYAILFDMQCFSPSQYISFNPYSWDSSITYVGVYIAYISFFQQGMYVLSRRM